MALMGRHSARISSTPDSGGSNNNDGLFFEVALTLDVADESWIQFYSHHLTRAYAESGHHFRSSNYTVVDSLRQTSHTGVCSLTIDLPRSIPIPCHTDYASGDNGGVTASTELLAAKRHAG